ncbi:DUF1801 domain-containing protein [Pedobacter aquatilis]|uniref:DUF1801 domain-containing protein n=1 Tax=Pedobacter aquatilis TaxID=351343 RepID=UPI00292E4195|nr:DUF1801 domain-containing protein [Pedobacter aquatilis]
MAKVEKSSPTEQVSALIQKLETKQGEIVELIRRLILNTDKEVAEQVKWNSPSFYYTGKIKSFDPKEYKRDIVVLNLHKGKILLVFPTGATINDTTGLLEGDYKDGRRLITLTSMEDVRSKGKLLQQIIQDWLSLVERE